MSRPMGRKEMYGKAKRFDPTMDLIYRKAIGTRLHNARLERDVSITELSAATGIHTSRISRVERGEASCLTISLCRIAVSLGMLPSELMP
jgi:DNA-binding Xre family transcriptional regulator